MKRRIIKSVLCVLLIVSLFVNTVVCGAVGENANLDFESNIVPDGWTAYNSFGQDFNSLRIETDMNNVHNGYYAARFSKVFDGTYYFKSDMLYVAPSVSYTFGGWIKTENAEGCRAYIVLEQELLTGLTVTTATEVLCGTVGEYTKIWGTVGCDPNVYTANISVVFTDDGSYYGGNATLYADDIFIYEAVMGDVTGDGAVDSKDLAVLKKVLLGLEQNQVVHDIDGSGNSDILDMVKLKKYIAKLC